MRIASGGRAEFTEIGAGGVQYVSSSGEAVATTVSSGGVQHVSFGGIVRDTQVKSGGSVIWESRTVLDGVVKLA